MYMDPLIHIVSKVLVPLFFFGLVGSVVVVVFSLIGDLIELTGEEE
jgi:hypothetical protein